LYCHRNHLYGAIFVRGYFFGSVKGKKKNVTVGEKTGRGEEKT
jgi:hypothetical protein